MDKYLLEILKDVNTIIIPGLGALTITNKDTGEIMFMPYLKHDDGKLSAYIAEKEGMEENDAKNLIAKYVREINTELDKGGSYDMFKFGSFVKSNDDIDFKNWENQDSETEPAPKEDKPADKPVDKEPKAAKKAADKKSEDPKPTTAAKTKKPAKAKTEEAPAKEEKVSAPKKIAKKKPDLVAEKKAKPKKEEKPKAEKKKSPAKEVKAPKVDKAPKEKTKIIPIVTAKTDTPKKETKKEVEKVDEKEKVAPVIVPPVIPVKADKESPIDSTSKPEKPELNILQKEERSATAAKLDKLKEAKENKPAKKKPASKKRGAGFWMLITLLLVIAVGSTLIAINYDDIRQHIPFLADKTETVDEKSPKEEMEDILNGGATSDEETPEQEPETVPETEDPVQPEVEGPVAEKIKAEPKTVSGNLPFHIIAGSFSSSKNAKRLVKKLKGMGYPAQVVKGRGKNLASVKSFGTKDQALAELSKIRGDATGAWIFEKK
jgi:SPOR domain